MVASDLDIARKATLRPIEEIAKAAGFSAETLQPYGRHIAKVDPKPYESCAPSAKLVLVTAISPTPAGEGKTTVSVGLADGMNAIHKKVMLALREPSLGPVFGMKGGATGGGYAQVLPMENINLHFTGDLHAITTTNNLLCAMVDNHIHQGNALGIDSRQVLFRYCMDMNDRQLRQIVTGLGGVKNGTVRETGFDITAASEIMAVFCLAADLKDLKARLSNIVVARTFSGQPITAGNIGAVGAMVALLRDALAPNLVQTIDGTPCLMHGGPFANIAHGCNSVVATRLAMRTADYVVTEAGFGADLGAEKFLDIKCRMNELWPSTIVLVATLRALKHHGGVEKLQLQQENLPALKQGTENLLAHIHNIRQVWNTPVVVAINRFSSDTDAEVSLLKNQLSALGVPCATCNAWAEGGKGAMDLAEIVCRSADANPSPIASYTYSDDLSLDQKIEAVCTRIYHAGEVVFTQSARQMLAKLQAEGYGHCPVCIAKTQYSLSDDPKALGAPKDFTITIRSVRLSAGAGFVVAFTGDIIAMPGLPKTPAALSIHVNDDGEIEGLF